MNWILGSSAIVLIAIFYFAVKQRQSEYEKLVKTVESMGGAISMDSPPCVFMAVEGVPSSATKTLLMQLRPLLESNKIDCLSLSGTDLSSEEITSFLRQCSAPLQTLDLSQTLVDKSAIEVLGKFNKLKQLSLPLKAASDGIHALSECESLETLFLHGQADDELEIKSIKDALYEVDIMVRRK